MRPAAAEDRNGERRPSYGCNAPPADRKAGEAPPCLLDLARRLRAARRILAGRHLAKRRFGRSAEAPEDPRLSGGRRLVRSNCSRDPAAGAILVPLAACAGSALRSAQLGRHPFTRQPGRVGAGRVRGASVAAAANALLLSSDHRPAGIRATGHNVRAGRAARDEQLLRIRARTHRLPQCANPAPADGALPAFRTQSRRIARQRRGRGLRHGGEHRVRPVLRAGRRGLRLRFHPRRR